MKTLKELSVSEMMLISGGSETAYQLGYAVGQAFRRVWRVIEIYTLLE